MVEISIKILSVVIIAIIIFSVDYLFLHLFWERLAVNIGIVIIYFILFVLIINK